MRAALLYSIAVLATLAVIRAEALWLDAHIVQAGRVAGVLVLAVLE
ncbi:hypothetical protein [Bradyrhizobium sp. NAS80.1]|nr:hypothetical protein [Bradyrhizobium sp. NAS80.1]